MKSFAREIKDILILGLIFDDVRQYYDAMEQLKAQDTLAAISNFDFVWALQPTAKAISKRTGKRYCDILMEAQYRLLAGEDMADVLWHFDSQLLNTPTRL